MEKVIKCTQCNKIFFGDKCPFCGNDKNFEVPDIFKDIFNTEG